MTVTTYIDQARERVDAERDGVAAKIDAIDAFVDRVRSFSPESVRPGSTTMAATAGIHAGSTASTEDRCRAVRTAFDETIRPRSVGDVDEAESLLETIEAEFSSSVAVALAPTNDTPFSPELKRTVISAAETRRTETEVLLEALDREAAQLGSAGDTVESITTWVASADETPLPQLGFETLQDRHEMLADHRGSCDTLVRERQAFLRQSTNCGVDAGIRNRQLVPYLYDGFSVDHPVLATVVKLDRICGECQRAVRAYLVRRA